MNDDTILYISVGLNVCLVFMNRSIWRKHLDLLRTFLHLLGVMRSIADLEVVAMRDPDGNIIIKPFKEIKNANSN